MHGYMPSHVLLPRLRVNSPPLKNSPDSGDAVHDFAFYLLDDFQRALLFAHGPVVYVVPLVIGQLFLVKSAIPLE